jgi:hypothetical protein
VHLFPLHSFVAVLHPQDAAAIGDDTAAQRPKKQRQPQRRRPAGQPCGGPAAAVETPPADGLDPGLVARLAAQRQQKFGCCGGQKGVARTSSGASPPADKDKPDSQPQPQAQQQQQRPSQQQRSLLASVSLQVPMLICSLTYSTAGAASCPAASFARVAGVEFDAPAQTYKTLAMQRAC